MQLARRSFIAGMASLIAAPTFANIVPAQVPSRQLLWAVTYDFHTGYHWVSNLTGRSALVKINRDKVFTGDLIAESEFEVQTYEVR